MKFNNDKEKLDAKEILRQGVSSQFWQLIMDATKESEEAIRKIQDDEEMADLPAEEYKFRNELYKAKRKFLDTLSKTPENIISWLESPNNESREFDPYEK